MFRKLRWAAICILACAASAQTTHYARKKVLWEPTLLIKPTDHLPKASNLKDMVPSLRVSDITVVLEETKLTDMRAHFGGTIGYRGDAGDFLQWLCFHGIAGNRRWVLWLMSGEVDSGTVGGFQWRLIPLLAQLDQRCQKLPGENGGIELPVAVRIGMTKARLLRVLGQPIFVRKEMLLYFHERELSIQNQPYTEMNLLAVLLRDRTAWTIEVWKSTIS